MTVYQDKCKLCLSYFQYKILLYTADGRCIDKFTAYNMALGIKSVAWSPTSQFLAIGSYDQKVMCIYIYIYIYIYKKIKIISLLLNIENMGIF